MQRSLITSTLIDEIRAFVKRWIPESHRGLALHAGDQIGVYPRALAGVFERVVVCEADPDNYAELKAAVSDLGNVNCLQVGLWNEPAKASMRLSRPGDRMTGYIVPGSGPIPLVTIDSLAVLPDLIWLDIEGAEHRALQGATSALEDCYAAIIEEAEGKNLEEQVADLPGAARRLLEAKGFTFRGKWQHLDSLFIRG